ncbi:MAG TPA: efflux RND transporter permease subunit [Candidatus Nanoarchaeia archaeon]|nr:efflux RND transporter permease subunit [Candidatus Nanoarchaeia archaeon]
MSTLSKALKNWRIIMLIAFLLFALIAINPNPWQEGVAIRSVAKNSAAAEAGISSVAAGTAPRSREILQSINNRQIKNMDDYNAFLLSLEPNRTITLQTSKTTYRLTTRPLLNITVLNETENVRINETVQENQTVDGKTELINKTVERTIKRNKTRSEILGVEDIGLRVYPAPKTNIKRGLDLEGGSRMLLEPETEVTNEELDIVISNMKERLNVYGLTDISVREVRDLSGKSYVLVELAGATEEEARSLISQQGKFEAKIANATAFRGGDVIYVCRSADCSGLDPNAGCGQQAGNWVCRFRFSITLSNEGAAQQAALTRELDIVDESGQQYLSKQIDLFLDDQPVDSLNIGAELKGKEVTEISISGSGSGVNMQDARADTFANMKKLQTILSTGSLPVKMKVVKMDTVSAVLGEKFTQNALLIGMVSIILVFLVVFIRYRMLSVTLPMIITMMSEVFLLLGVAAIFKWNLDLAAIAGIIIATGTGVDDQIVIVDEALKGSSKGLSWKDKLKKAFFIIFAALFATLAAMFPLLFAGAGMLRGFGLTTSLGVLIGVLVTRPAYAFIVGLMMERKQHSAEQ